MTSMLSHLTVEQQSADQLSLAPELAVAEAPEPDPGRALEDWLKVIADAAPKDPSYWVG